MTARTEEWSQVADAVSGLALKLKLHFEEAAGETAEQAKTAVDAIGDSVEAAFEGLTASVKDDAVKQDVKDVAAGLRDALSNTFADLASQLHVSCGERKSA
jgi:enamine deaminase RidA (YjgF/YER057c/UK114 family)